MNLESSVDQLFDWKPEEIDAYYLRHTVIKKFRIDEFTYIVMQMDLNTMKGKSLMCISPEHAEWVYEACVNMVRPHIN